MSYVDVLNVRFLIINSDSDWFVVDLSYSCSMLYDKFTTIRSSGVLG